MFLRYSIFAWLWAVIIMLLCGLPGNDFPVVSLWKLLSFDKAAHATIYSVFAFLWANAFAKQHSYHFLWRKPVLFALTGGILYGIMMEILQALIFIDRSAEFADIIANTAGCFLGAGIFILIYRPVLHLRQWPHT